MIREEIKNIKSGKKDLRDFGITMGVVIAIFAAVFFLRKKSYWDICAVISICFFASGFICPVILKPIQKIWMILAVLMGWVMTRIILSVLFYLGMTPLSLLLKLFGKKFLDKKFDRNTESYWIDRNSEDEDRSLSEKQY